MPQYGKLKIDQFLYNDSGTDVTLDLANLASKGANTFTGHQSHGDNIEARFGTDNDLLILHNNSSGFIWNTTGDTLLRGSGNGWINIQPKSGEAGIVVKPDNATELYYDNSKKFETTSGGASVTGALDCDSFDCSGSLNVSGNATYHGNLDLHDNDTLRLGTGDDLQIHHDGTQSWIYNYTGNLNLGVNSDYAVRMIPDGAVELYYDGSKKLETTNAGVKITGSLGLQMNNCDVYIDDGRTVTFGGSNDLQIFHDGSNYGFILNNTGDLVIKNDNSSTNAIRIRSKGDEEDIVCNANGAVEIYYDNSKKLETISGGISVTGGVNTTAASSFGGDLFFGDNKKAVFGAGDDLQIYHDGSHSYIADTGTGRLHINTSELRVNNAADNEILISAAENGAVELYYDNSKKLETTSGGVTVTGTCTATAFSGDGSGLTGVSGTTINNNANNRIITGSDTANTLEAESTLTWNGSELESSAAMLLKPAGNLTLETSGSSRMFVTIGGRVDVTTGDRWSMDVGSRFDVDAGSRVTFDAPMFIASANSFNFYGGSSGLNESIFSGAVNGAVELYYDNSKKFNTTSGGCYVHGNLYPTSNGSGSIGTSNERWADIYVNDMHFSNEGKSNSVDGTWGDWTLQEGDENIFMINNRTGKKYKMGLQEVN